MKSMLISIEDLILTSSRPATIAKPQDAQKRGAKNVDLDLDEETHLEEMLEKQRTSMLESDSLLKDMWANKKSPSSIEDGVAF